MNASVAETDQFRRWFDGCAVGDSLGWLLLVIHATPDLATIADSGLNAQAWGTIKSGVDSTSRRIQRRQARLR